MSNPDLLVAVDILVGEMVAFYQIPVCIVCIFDSL